MPTLAPQFVDAMNDDLAVPLVLAQIAENLRIGNIALTNNDDKAISAAANEIRGALEILGCDPFDPAFASSAADLTPTLDGVIALALEQRNAARARKDFAASDAIRDGLSDLGVSIEDTPQGPRWSITPMEKR
jgi:cysteinyl-tRNA synthetase